MVSLSCNFCWQGIIHFIKIEFKNIMNDFIFLLFYFLNRIMIETLCVKGIQRLHCYVEDKKVDVGP